LRIFSKRYTDHERCRDDQFLCDWAIVHLLHWLGDEWLSGWLWKELQTSPWLTAIHRIVESCGEEAIPSK
jgi:hypothetical protein